MSAPVRLTRRDFGGKTIDVHSHVGVSLKALACQEYPYAATIEGIYYRQRASGVDVNVVFPLSADLFFDPQQTLAGKCVPAERPLSPSPYATENESILREVHTYCPEYAGRFLPFVCVDPGRRVADQVKHLRELDKRFAIYGIKINPVICQSPITELLHEGKAFLDLAREKNWPMLLHTTPQEFEQYSRASLTLPILERNPDVRFCLAHCIGFDRDYLDRADAMPHVWVDSSALTIHTQLVREEGEVLVSVQRRVEADYTDPGKVLTVLVTRYPNTMMWGSDTPAYSYICRRQQAEGVFQEFRLKANYEDEVLALNALPPGLRQKAANTNILDFLFGKEN